MSKKVKYIKEFLFDSAQYFVADENGNRVLLKINYKDNSYLIQRDKQCIALAFSKEVEEVALGLLHKKHGVNRAKYIRK